MKNTNSGFLRKIVFLILFLNLFLTVFAQDSLPKNQPGLGEKIKLLLKDLEKSPQDYYLNLHLGWNYFLLGKFANALHHYGIAIKEKPRSLEPKLGSARVCMAIMDYPKSEAFCRSVLEIDPINYHGSLYLANALTAQNRYREALVVIANILVYYPGDLVLIEKFKYYESVLKK